MDAKRKRYGPKIVFFDLETLPDLNEALKVWPQLSNYFGLTLKASITSIICAGYRIYGHRKIECINAWDFPNWKKDVNDDRVIAKKIYDVLKDADAVVTHNGKRFDWKFLQTRLLKHGYDPLPNTHHIDTKEVAKRHLFLFNNKLKTVAQLLTDDNKMDHGQGWDLWVKVHQRDEKAMRLMERYCKQDVRVLEKAFEKLKPVINNIPNYNLFYVDTVCPNCGGTNFRSEGWRVTKTKKYRRLYCKECGTRSRTDATGFKPRTF